MEICNSPLKFLEGTTIRLEGDRINLTKTGSDCYFPLAHNDSYLLRIYEDPKTHIHELRIVRGEIRGDVKYTFLLDSRIFGGAINPHGEINFGRFYVDGVTDPVWGMQGIGISDITDIKPSGPIALPYKLYQTFDLTYTDAVQIQYVDGNIFVKVLHKREIVKIRISQ